MFGPSTYVFLLFVSVSTRDCNVDAARILLMPSNHHSDVNLFAVAARVLDKAGHNITVFTRDTHRKLLTSKGVNTILHHVSSKRHIPETSQFNELLKEGSYVKFLKAVSDFARSSNDLCRDYLENKEIMEIINNANFDLAIVSGVTVARCNFVIPYKYSIPFITLTYVLEPWQSRVGALPSVEPMYGITRYGNKMNLLYRIGNFIIYLAVNSVGPFMFVENDLIEEYCPERPQISIHELYHLSGIWLLNHDIYCIDYPRVSAPNYHFLGNLATEPSKPLPADLEQYVASAKGLVVVSFGSIIGNLPLPVFHKLMGAFIKRPEKFVMRFSGEQQPENVPGNVKLLKWLPQNDLLGHKKTVLFITHGGHNSQVEGHYHGVPMVVMPVFGDQVYNGIRVEDKGHGKHLNLYSSSSEQVLEAIKEVIENSVYRRTIQKCMKIAAAVNTPKETLVFWVNHVLEHGADHLKGHGFELSLFQFLMIDVYIILLVILVVLCGCCAYCACGCWRCCCRRSRKDKQE